MKTSLGNLADKFVVYTASLNGIIVYVGSGKFGRQLHCLSGCSHVYGLNKLHFESTEVIVKIVGYYDNKQESLDIEKHLILTNKPAFNKKDNPDVEISSNTWTFSKWDTYLRQNLGSRKYWLFSGLIKELITFFGVKNLVSERGVNLQGMLKHGKIPNNLRAFLSCKRKQGSYVKYKELYDVLCTEPGFVKLPQTPTIKQTIKEQNDKAN